MKNIMKLLVCIVLFVICLCPVKADADNTLTLHCKYNKGSDSVNIDLIYNTDDDFFHFESLDKYKKKANGKYLLNDACRADDNYYASCGLTSHHYFRYSQDGFSHCPEYLWVGYDYSDLLCTGYISVPTYRCYIEGHSTNEGVGLSFSARDVYHLVQETYTGDLEISKNREFNAQAEKMKYKDVEICEDKGWEYISACGCMPASLTDLTSRLYKLLKIGAPALLLVIGGFEMIKAMTSQDEASIKKAEQKLVKKFVAAAAVFLILTVVQFLASVLSTDSTMLECLGYLLDGYNV